MRDAVVKLDPRRTCARTNPVIFIVELVSAFVSSSSRLADPTTHLFAWPVDVWLWFTVLFANFAEAVAEGRGKAQAEPAPDPGRDHRAACGAPTGRSRTCPRHPLVAGDVVVVAAGEVIPADGEVIEGIASVDESAITGESARSSASLAATAPL